MRLLLLLLIALAALIQYPLWIGKGGWFRAWELQGQVADQREVNDGLRARNAALAAEVDDLRTGTGALEERARGDLGMMRGDEVFVQILPYDEKPPVSAAQAGAIPAAAGRAAATHTAPPRAAPTTGAARPAAGQRAPASR